MRDMIVGILALAFGLWMARDCVKSWRVKKVIVSADTSFEDELVRQKEKPFRFWLTMCAYSLVTVAWIAWALIKIGGSQR